MRKSAFKQRLLLELEENKIDYGWATDSVLDLCTFNPDIIPFVTKAPAHTQHYVVLALLGFMERTNGKAGMRDISRRIATENRRALLSEVWGRDFGSTRILPKLCPGIFPKAYYLLFVACLAEPERRACFRDVGPIYHLLIERIAIASPKHLARYKPIILANFGGLTLDFFCEGLSRLRPDLHADDILARMNALKSASGMIRLMEALTKDMSAPPPIWPGTKTIVPLRSAHDFRAAGLQMRNCLGSFEFWIEGLIQKRVFYLCAGKEPAIAALQRHRLFDLWFLQEVGGKENRRLSPERKTEIIDTFAAAGFLYPDHLVLGGMRLPGF